MYVAPMTLTLDMPGLRAAQNGHEYVFNRAPDEVEANGLRGFLSADDDAACVASYRGGVALHVTGLSDATRPAFENLLRVSLVRINRDRDVAQTVATGGKDWAEGAQARADEAEAAVQASFDVLPDKLP